MESPQQMYQDFKQVLESNQIDKAFTALSKFMQSNDIQGSVKFNFTNLESKKKYKVTIERID
jgi:hypothetical protein